MKVRDDGYCPTVFPPRCEAIRLFRCLAKQIFIAGHFEHSSFNVVVDTETEHPQQRWFKVNVCESNNWSLSGLLLFCYRLRSSDERLAGELTG